MSDFPRGWTLASNQGAGTAASIVVPAIAGVVHVLDSLTATLTALAAAAVGTAIAVTLTSSDGVFTGLVLVTVSNAGGAVDAGQGSLSGLDLAAGPGASLTIAFNAVTPANYTELLVVQGHDI